MMRHNNILTILTITMSLWLGNTSYAAFDLFNPDRGKPPPPKPTAKTKSVTSLATPFKARPFNPSQRRSSHSSTNPPPQKDFTLSGTSRIGSRRAVILKGPDNKEFIQYFENNQRTPIKGYEGYYLVSVEAREVQIEYPTDFPCREDRPQKALKCETDNNNTVAVLNLMQRKALPVKITPKSPTPAVDKAKKREEDRKKRKELYKNFKRKVIKDEDVPPGMRVVRTPFGDRLVPIK